MRATLPALCLLALPSLAHAQADGHLWEARQKSRAFVAAFAAKATAAGYKVVPYRGSDPAGGFYALQAADARKDTRALFLTCLVQGQWQGGCLVLAQTAPDGSEVFDPQTATEIRPLYALIGPAANVQQFRAAVGLP